MEGIDKLSRLMIEMSELREDVNRFCEKNMFNVATLLNEFSALDKEREHYKERADAQCWIPVTTCLPKRGKTVLMVCSNRICEGALDRDGEWAWVSRGTIIANCSGDKVTHWMPLPEPPNPTH